MRKQFNFYRSYFDVMKELPTDKDRLSFVMALLEKQFENIEPKLTGMAKFAYISQAHSINSQVNGYITKQESLGEQAFSPATQGATEGASVGATEGALAQVEEKWEVKRKLEKVTEKFEVFWSAYEKKVEKANALIEWKKLTEDEMQKAIEAASKYRINTPDPKFRKHPHRWLKAKKWEDEVSVPSNAPAYTPPPQERTYTRLTDWLKAHPNAYEDSLIGNFMRAGIDPDDHGACRRWLLENGYSIIESTQMVYLTERWMERMSKA